MIKKYLFIIISIIMTGSILFVPGTCETPEQCWIRCIKEKQRGGEPPETNCDEICEPETSEGNDA